MTTNPPNVEAKAHAKHRANEPQSLLDEVKSMLAGEHAAKQWENTKTQMNIPVHYKPIGTHAQRGYSLSCVLAALSRGRALMRVK